MKQKSFSFLFLAITLIFSIRVSGQNFASIKDSSRIYKVAIIAPLYLDSVFNNNGFKYDKSFPKFVLPGFDFLQGAQMALDSLGRAGYNVKASFFDSKSNTKDIESLVNSGGLNNIELIIGAVKDKEYFTLADFAKKKNVPFISATYPNDGGIKNNPFLIIVNSTLKAHCETIFSYLLSNHGTEKILFVRKSGVRGDFLTDYFDELNTQDGKKLLNLEKVNVDTDDFSILQLKLDSTKNTIVIGASLNEDFATNLTKELALLNKKYKSTLIGMPNWDGFAQPGNKIRDYPLYYTTPFYNNKGQKETKEITAKYRSSFKGSPSDMVFKGFETTCYFVKLLAKHPNDLMNHLNDQDCRIFTQPLYRPQFTSTTDPIPDYFENKSLYFMKSVNGIVVKAW